MEPTLTSFLTDTQTRTLASRYPTPFYVWSGATIQRRVNELLSMPSAYGMTHRFAMKACPTGAIIQLMYRFGLGIDASSIYEVARARRAGVSPTSISLTAQELPEDVDELLKAGIWINATSLSQIDILANAARRLSYAPMPIGIRVNPGLGSGHSNRTNVGGPSSSFGIWWEYVQEAKQRAARGDLRITTLHSHIGSGADPGVWERCAELTLRWASDLPNVEKVSLGGGFKVARMPGDPEIDLKGSGERIAHQFRRFAEQTGRQLKLEVEPGAYLMAPAGAIVSRVIDIVDTGPEGNHFIKLDTGMTEILRPCLYGAQHPISIISSDGSSRSERRKFVVVGHCCESGDILTPLPGDPEAIGPRELPAPKRGDLVVIGSAGAYTSGMAAVNYNSFPQAAEVLIDDSGRDYLVRRRQSVDEITHNEMLL